MWHDGATITNHGFLACEVNILYDPAVFYTTAEYKKLTGEKIDVQKEVETPELYIFARCGNNDDQLAYIPTRVHDLLQLKTGINLNEVDEKIDGITIYDVMRFFRGDGPASALESGNQKGGHYFCPSCNIHIYNTHDISHC